jgi:hypothetical protein
MSSELMNRLPGSPCTIICKTQDRAAGAPLSVKRGLSFCLLLYPAAAARARMQLRFEVFHLAFKLIDPLPRENM